MFSIAGIEFGLPLDVGDGVNGLALLFADGLDARLGGFIYAFVEIGARLLAFLQLLFRI